jgi:serine/threonine protein phosphatase 1
VTSDPTISKRSSQSGGRLIYAVGDIHGRADLLDRLLERIAEDVRLSAHEAKPVLVFVGDYVDRGPSSKAVIDRLISVEREGAFEVCALKGNHEAALLAFLDEPATGAEWCEHGGLQTLNAYHVQPPSAPDDTEAWRKTRDRLALVLPPEHLTFLGRLRLTATFGGYLFVHAGLRPGLPLAAQSESDLLGIRDEFLLDPGPFEHVVVHGHTPVEAASFDNATINVDTGAFATGVLTAVRLEGAERRLIQVGQAEYRYEDPPPAPTSSWLSEHGLNIATLLLSIVALSLVGALVVKNKPSRAATNTPRIESQSER